MANYISGAIIKSYELTNFCRDENGMGKNCIMGGATRRYVTSASHRHSIKNGDSELNESLRTTHCEDLIEKILNGLVSKGDIEESEVEDLGKDICSLLSCDWNKRSSIKSKKEESKKTETEEENDEENKPKDKGCSPVVATPAEIISVVDAVIRCENKKDRKQAAMDALDSIRMSKDQAMFGTMATGGLKRTVDGAVKSGNAYSLNAYIPENSFGSMSYNGGHIEERDPFYGEVSEFSNERESRPEAENLYDKWLSSDIMFFNTFVEIDPLKENLSKSVRSTKMDISEDDLLEDVTECVVRYMFDFADSDPEGGQNASVSHPGFDIYYIESVKDGYLRNVSFNDHDFPIGNCDLVKKGINRIYNYSTKERNKKGITRYVRLSYKYDEEFEEMFEKAGIKVIRDDEEFERIIREEVKRLY